MSGKEIISALVRRNPAKKDCTMKTIENGIVYEPTDRLLKVVNNGLSFVKEVCLATALNDLSALCRYRADRWYHDPKTGLRIFLNHGERFALMHSELSEAFEGVRKDKAQLPVH